MIKMSPASWAAVIIVALVQTAVLASIIYGRASLLQDGREIVVEVVPVDPRDIFRGDYVILGYGFNQRGNVEVPPETVTGDTVYVTLKPTGPEQWEMASVSRTLVQPADPAEVVLKGTAQSVYRPANGQPPLGMIRFGIESYYVPEGTGRELEKKVMEKKISAVLAVGASGEVAIKALVIDGERVAEAPWL